MLLPQTRKGGGGGGAHKRQWGRVEALECKGDSHKVDALSRGKNLKEY